MGDNALPQINSLVKDNENPTNGNVILTGKAQDTHSGIVGYMFSTDPNLTKDSEGWNVITSTINEITVTYEAEENEKYYFYVNCFCLY